MVARTAMLRFSVISAVLMLLAVAACTPPKDSAFFNRGGPEALLDVSSEVVNLRIDTASKLIDLSNWIAKDQPTRAELYCHAGEPRCNEARKVLELNAVPVAVIPSNDYSVALIYERILARDCNQRYVDDSHNMYNTVHPAFGCSVSANMVQQVADKQQFVNPNISDEPNADAAADAYHRAYTRSSETKKDYSVGDSLASKAKSGD